MKERRDAEQDLEIAREFEMEEEVEEVRPSPLCHIILIGGMVDD